MNILSIAILFQQPGPAETTDYMILGLGVVFGIMLIYLISLSVRNSNLKKDMAMLEQLEEVDDRLDQVT